MSESIEATHSRFVLLGASNLAQSFPFLVQHIRRLTGGRGEIYGAIGHGRSFGQWSHVFFRGLPGIRNCRLWEQLPAASSDGRCRSYALLTDVGNDLLYGADVDTIVAWVRECLERLQERQARIIVTGLPLGSIERLSPRRFLLARTLLFPGSRLTWESVQQRAQELHTAIEQLAREHAATFLVPRAEWYGLDPIHIRRGLRPAVWSEMLSHWEELPDPGTATRSRSLATVSLRDAVLLHTLRPECHTLFGRPRTTPQPALDERDFRVWLY